MGLSVPVSVGPVQGGGGRATVEASCPGCLGRGPDTLCSGVLGHRPLSWVRTQLWDPSWYPNLTVHSATLPSPAQHSGGHLPMPLVGASPHP